MSKLTLLSIVAVFMTACSGRPQSSVPDSSQSGAPPIQEETKKTNKPYVEIEDKGDLTVYYPNFTRIDLATGTMPSQSENDVIFCCAASFTGQLLEEFKHSNIAGNHVSGGTYYKGYKAGTNNGVFTWSRKSGPKFFNYSHDNSVQVLQKAAEEGGMGFGQSMLFCNGDRFKGCFKPGSRNRYRALCELDGRICVIDCARILSFKEFLDGLEDLGVKNALYCDMGTGWNYSWYRKDDGTVQELFPVKGQFTTNWIVFYNDQQSK